MRICAEPIKLLLRGHIEAWHNERGQGSSNVGWHQIEQVAWLHYFHLQAGIGTDSVWASGMSRLAQMWSLLQMGDYVSYYLALNYGGRGEIVRAMQNMLREGLRPEDVTEQTLSDHLYTAGQPDPDLLIRTSGEQRLSNYLLYQCAYSELYFTQVAWPDFDAAQLRLALEAYAARSRRFGKTQEQIDAH